MNQTRLILRRLSQSSTSSSSSLFRNVLTTTTFRKYFCTTTTATKHTDTLCSKIFNLQYTTSGNPDDVVTPMLDEWIRQGNPVNPTDLRYIVTELYRCRRCKYALEVSRWMTDKNLIEVTPKDVALHLNLIAWVYGVEGAEKYFNEIPKKLRTSFVYTTLLTCFANADCVEKAEAFMQKMKKLGLASYSAPYHVMLKLHWRKHNRDKLAAVVREMEENNVKYDGITYTILLNAYGSYRDIDGLESLGTKMESGPEHKTNWVTYVLVVRHFIEDQLVDKATELLKKAEKRILLDKDYESYWFIVYLYGAWGKKEEVSRVWEECKKRKVDNEHYMSVFPALLKLKDVEIAENIYKDWEDNSNLLKDIRIPNYMIKIYCKNGLIEKAESLIERMKSENGENFNSYMWWPWISFGYVKRNQMDKAVEVLKSALSETNCLVLRKSNLEGFAACLKYLKDEGDSEEEINAIIETLKDRRLIPAKVLEKLVEYLSGACDIEDVLKTDNED